jgi:hypothetical protein
MVVVERQEERSEVVDPVDTAADDLDVAHVRPGRRSQTDHGSTLAMVRRVRAGSHSGPRTIVTRK